MFTRSWTTSLAIGLGSFGLVWGQPCATPSNVTATPSMVCNGSASQLNATSTNNSINWYTVPSGGSALGSSGSGVNYPVTPTANTTYYAEAIGASNGSQSFAFTGALQSFTVPPGVSSLTIVATGAQGGHAGGLGASITGTFSVSSGEVLSVLIGGQGAEYSNGIGGGGGGTFIWKNTGTVLLVAAAGGGGTSSNSNSSVGGPGSGTTTPTTSINGSGNAAGGTGGNGGNGGSVACSGSVSYPAGGGGGAGWSSNGTTGSFTYGATGGSTPLNGGAGGTGFNPCGNVNVAGGFGGGGGAGGCSGASGGGGGYNGGGGGNCWNGSTWGSGGGGGSFNGGTSQTNTTGVQSGNGNATFTWTGTNCTASPRVPVTVTLDSIAPVAVCQSATVNLDQFGNGTLSGSDIDGGSTDNCTIDSLLCQSAFTCADAGTNTIVLTVVDNNGNSSTCSATVSVLGTAMTLTTFADTTNCGLNVTCPGGADGIAHADINGGCPGYTYQWSDGQTTSIATNLAAGTYTVTVTDAGGATTVGTVVLAGPPAFQVSASTTPSCSGNNDGSITVFNVTGGSCQGSYTFLWQTGDSTVGISNLAPGNYNVTVTDADGCDFVQSIAVPTLPAPNPTFTQSGFTLTSSQSWVTYQWLLNGTNIPGANANTYTATASGSYALQVTDTNGCTGVSDTTNVTIIGIGQTMGDWADLSLYPNPAKSEFRLRTAAPIATGVAVEVTDMFGRTVFIRTLPELAFEASFDIRTLAAGTYMVAVNSEQGQHKVFRLVIGR